ncbi:MULTISPECIES: hypothetical protein [Clostridium]|uniref:hypothetical protein n=1 Tax=Clostridium TaxID=1485 RepID=UPI000826E188|nr:MULTISPECIES: hypothetical protein [Clostridium]PJI06865.1 hypothetical protein CUB90_02830 [Clostridium sp. CT7]
MDVTRIQNTSVQNYHSETSTKKTNDKTNTEDVETKYSGADTFVKSTEDNSEPSTYEPVKKKLSAKEVQELKDAENNSKADFIEKFIKDTIYTQNTLLGRSTENAQPEISKTTSDLLTKIFGSLEKAYPPIETTPEDAKKAISKGGAYSVEAVSDRIMTMAKALAGDDKEKLQQMRDAVEKGFAQAGVDFKRATTSDLPQICNDTHTEIMKRFDELQGKDTKVNSKDKNK